MPQGSRRDTTPVFCLAVLEHVLRAWDAVRGNAPRPQAGQEARGPCAVLEPLPCDGDYYSDVRLTSDGIRALCAEFASVDVVPVRGLAETWPISCRAGNVPSVPLRVGSTLHPFRKADVGALFCRFFDMRASVFGANSKVYAAAFRVVLVIGTWIRIDMETFAGGKKILVVTSTLPWPPLGAGQQDRLGRIILEVAPFGL